MKFFRSIIPNLTIVLALCLLTVLVLDNRNPMMSFVDCVPFKVLAAATCVCAIASAVTLYGSWREYNDRCYRKQQQRLKEERAARRAAREQHRAEEHYFSGK